MTSFLCAWLNFFHRSVIWASFKERGRVKSDGETDTCASGRHVDGLETKRRKRFDLGFQESEKSKLSNNRTVPTASCSQIEDLCLRINLRFVLSKTRLAAQMP